MSSTGNTSFSLDFRRDNSQEQRPYFVIGTINGSKNAIQDLAHQFRAQKLEVLDINPGYRNSLTLPANFQGIAILIQDHVANDLDHSHGMHTGSNIFQTYKTIQQIRPLNVEDHAKTEMEQVQKQRSELGDVADEVMPQYKELNKLIALFKKVAPVDDRKVAEQLQKEENQATAQQINEQIQSLQFLLNDPETSEAQKKVYREELKLLQRLAL